MELFDLSACVDFECKLFYEKMFWMLLYFNIVSLNSCVEKCYFSTQLLIFEKPYQYNTYKWSLL